MSALTREELIEACAALYAAANDNFMLPPLIHGAGDAQAASRSSYRCLGGDIRIEFVVAFDAEQVRQSGFPLEKLPVRFKAQLSDREGRDLPIPLGETEMAALTYAFLLGVKAPISLELDDDAPEGKCSIQLAPTFFVEWRQPFETGEQITSEQICRSVGRSLCGKSREFFITESDGVSIWSLRAAQELLGEPKPSADELWTRFSPTLLLPGAAQAVSATIARIEPPAPAALAPMGALRRPEARKLRYAAAAALALMSAFGASRFFAAPHDGPGPRIETSLLTPAPPRDEEGREPVFEPMIVASVEAPFDQQAEPPAPLSAARESAIEPAAVAEAAAETSIAPLIVAPGPKAAPMPPRKPIAVSKLAAAVANASAVPPAQSGSRNVARQPSSPLDLVGRALSRFTTDFAKGFHRLTTL